jgi:hypothetical protein
LINGMSTATQHTAAANRKTWPTRPLNACALYNLIINM